jgi:hypothetical protein
MADEPNAQEPEAPPVEMTDPDFDWDAFWGPATPTQEPIQVQAEGYEDVSDEVEDERAKELAALRKQTEVNARALEEMRNEKHLDHAIEEWKKQASPAELALSDLLYESQSLDELKKNAARVKKAATKAEEIYGEQLKRKEAELEREVQAKFGLPVPPSFQPIPQQDKANQALADGDLDRAAAIMLEGMF